MLGYIFRRVVIMVPLWIFLSVITLFLIELPPGDVVTSQVTFLRSQNVEVDDATVERLRAQWGLDDPFHVRYLHWIENAFLRGDLGNSVDGRANLDKLKETIPYTIVIAVGAFIVAWGVAIPLGLYSATHQYSVVDYVVTFLGFFGLGAPGWLLAILVAWASLYFFDFVPLGANSLQYLGTPWGWEKAVDSAKHLWAPIILTAIPVLGATIRIVRNNLLDQLGQQYVTTARAKGLTEAHLILKYPTKIAINPLISELGLLVYGIISQQTLICIVLGLPTMGPLLLSSLQSQDMILAGTILLIYATIIWLSTLASDILLAWTDPRIRYEGRSR